MTCVRFWPSLAIATTALLVSATSAQAQYPGSPYGYQIRNGQIGPGYGAGYGFNARAYYGGARGAGTVTDYQSLMSAITLVPGWNGPVAPARPVHPRPTMARDQLLGPDGKVLWPSATPENPARQAAEAAVQVVIDENSKYGHPTVRHVVDARNKLTTFAGQVLPALKARNAADADGLERFVVELKKTLAAMAVNY